MSAHHRGDLVGAIAWFEGCVQMQPRWHTAYNNLAALYAAVGNSAAAREALRMRDEAVAAAGSIRPVLG